MSSDKSDSSSGSGVVLPAINFVITPREAPTEGQVASASATAIAKAIEDEAAKSTFAFPMAKRSYIEITKENGVTDTTRSNRSKAANIISESITITQRIPQMVPSIYLAKAASIIGR